MDKIYDKMFWQELWVVILKVLCVLLDIGLPEDCKQLSTRSQFEGRYCESLCLVKC